MHSYWQAVYCTLWVSEIFCKLVNAFSAIYLENVSFEFFLMVVCLGINRLTGNVLCGSVLFYGHLLFTLVLNKPLFNTISVLALFLRCFDTNRSGYTKGTNFLYYRLQGLNEQLIIG